ncbi:MAG: S41 family peptidase [Prevotella sp.]|nr:S41 family peptidase [Prevotella sp.]
MKKTFITLAACLLTIAAQAQYISLGKNTPLGKLQYAEAAINGLYVDEVNEEKLVEDAIRGMLEKLDPHSSYSTAEEVKKLNEPLQGNFDGIGIQFNMIDDTLVVIQPTLKGPSEKVGIVPGDRIITVNDTTIAGVKMDRTDIMKRLRGPKGTQVKLGIQRKGIKELIYFNVVRDKIPVKSIEASYIIKPGVGYIRINNFGATTYDEFMESVEKLKKQGMKKLMVDLQENGGGYLESAVNIANEFLETNDLIVYTEGRKTHRRDYHADGKGSLRKIKVVVLVNEFSASASEILTGAIQDHDRGMVVGRRTFGKGLVQRPITLPDESMIRLTVAHYYTPSGRCIQKPYKKGELKEYEQDFENRLKHGELTSRDSIHFDDSLKYETLKLHRTVYGGGGIMPDEFVPLDTLQYTKFHRKLAAKSIIINANLRYIDNHRDELKGAFKNFDDFNAHYEVPQSLIDQIVAEGEKQDVKPVDDEELQRTLPYLRRQLKALVARDIWDMSEYFQVMNEVSHIVQKGLEVIDK